MFKVVANLMGGDQKPLPPLGQNGAGMVSRVLALSVRYGRMFANLAQSCAQHVGGDECADPYKVKPRLAKSGEQS